MYISDETFYPTLFLRQYEALAIHSMVYIFHCRLPPSAAKLLYVIMLNSGLYMYSKIIVLLMRFGVHKVHNLSLTLFL